MKRIILLIIAIATTLMTSIARESEKIVLLPKDAIIEGDITISKNGHIGRWRRIEDEIKFKIPELKQGKYKIIIEYSAANNELNGGDISFQFNDEIYKESFGATGGWLLHEGQTIGYYKHSGGPLDITLTIIKPTMKNKASINVFSLILEKK